MKERRKTSKSTFSALPKDYLSMITDVFAVNFSEQLKKMNETHQLQFEAAGEIYSDEIVVHLSLAEKGKLAATTVHASSDFDPKASSPTAEDILAVCVDGIGDVFLSLFEQLPEDGTPAVLSSSISSFKKIPLLWTEIESSKRKIFVKVDKSNLTLDLATDDWLEKNDPDYKQQREAEEKQASDLFIMPPKNSSGKGGSGLH